MLGYSSIFGSSTGERFAGGLIGYALEMAIDDVWKESTKQEEAVIETKVKLLMKAISIFLIAMFLQILM